jgi:hypothetical protein
MTCLRDGEGAGYVPRNPIDGKTVGRSFDHEREQSPLHLVSA